MRLVNVGASSAIGGREELGYPVCTVCGQSVSPLSSERQRSQFTDSHRERCGRVPRSIGFYADVVADALSLPACDDAEDRVQRLWRRCASEPPECSTCTWTTSRYS